MLTRNDNASSMSLYMPDSDCVYRGSAVDDPKTVIAVVGCGIRMVNFTFPFSQDPLSKFYQISKNTRIPFPQDPLSKFYQNFQKHINLSIFTIIK